MLSCLLMPVSVCAAQGAASRQDLARAYLQLEEIYFSAERDADTANRINRAFDTATMAFFTGQYGAAVRTIHAMVWSLDQTGDRTARDLVAMSTKVTVHNPVVALNTLADEGARGIEATVGLLHDLPLTEYADTLADAETVSIIAELRDSAGAVMARTEIPVSTEPGTGRRAEIVPVDVLRTLRPGRYDIVLRGDADAGSSAQPVRCFIMNESMDDIKVRLEALLMEASADEADMEMPLRQALASAASRAALLSDVPSERSSAEFLADQSALAELVEMELQAIQRGENPYARSGMDVWRSLHLNGTDLPVRIFVPHLPAHQVRFGLIIALHGAGGDENMFMDGYGFGVIRELAQQHQMVVVSPATMIFSRDPAWFDLIVDLMAAEQNIDRDRVYLIGHSMGAAAAAQLASQRSDSLAGVGLLAGAAGWPSDRPMPPVFVAAGELDPLAAPARVRRGMAAAIDAGMDIDMRLVRNYGHTLMVGRILPDLFEWMAARAGNR